MTAQLKSARVRRAEASFGRTFAKAWRTRMQPYFDRLYGVALPEGEGAFPYPGHRTCADWSEAEAA